MIAVGSLLFIAFVAQTPADSLRQDAVRLSETALVAAIRARPLVAREAITTALARSQLDAAHNLATAYAVAWTDSFLVREVARFASWPPERRAAKVWADSVRRAGVAAYGRDGPSAALAVWRRSLARAAAIKDTAGVAAVSGNIGASFLADGQVDSAESYLQRARSLALAIGDRRVEANALVGLGEAREDRGDPAAARELYGQARAAHERIGDTRGVAADDNNLGLLAQGAGDLGEARRRFEAALALNRGDGRNGVAATNLVNLAGLASLDGDFARAERLYRDALATWREEEAWADAAAALHGLGQLELRRGDYPAARVALQEALVIYQRTGPLESALTVRRVLAEAFAGQGDLQGAVDALRIAQQRADSARAAPATRAGIALARADLALRLNSLAAAERLYGRAEFLYRQAGDAGGAAEAQEGRGALFLAKGDYSRAQTLLEAALRVQLATGNQRAAALTRLALGDVAKERGDTAAARDAYGRAATDLRRLGDPVAAAAATGDQASLAAATGLPVAAESLYHAALDQVRGHEAPEITWHLHAGRALVLRGRGSPDEAVRELRTAIADIEVPGRTLTAPERRSGYLADKWDVYAQLALMEQARQRPATAFDVSERLRAREMLELLARGRVAPADTAADLVAHEQDLRRRIGELTAALEVAPTASESLRGPEVAATATTTREALLQAQAAYADLLLEMQDQAPRHAALLAPRSIVWRDVAARLDGDAAFVEYLLSDSDAVAFVITRDTLVVVNLGITRHDLARLVEFARGTVERRPAPSDSLWRGSLRRLDAFLIAPLEDAGLLAGKSRLVLVPHAELHYLPFAALLDPRGRFLVERYALVETPSAAVWLSLGERHRTRPTTGVLALAPARALPGSRDEVAAIARYAGSDARVLVGAAATEDAFRRDAPSRRIVHLATYGVLNKQNPLFSYVDLAPGSGEDGHLEVHEVFGLSLAADLVVLSACQTGLASGAQSDVPSGDDWVGLTRAFLQAGAARVVASLWPVEDRATADLMERFYERYAADSDPVAALGMAQRALLTQAPLRHPFYWAGFVVVGSGAPHE